MMINNDDISNGNCNDDDVFFFQATFTARQTLIEMIGGKESLLERSKNCRIIWWVVCFIVLSLL